MTATLRIAIVGASSGIAEGAARAWASKDHAEFFLVGRNQEKTQKLANDLKARGASKVSTYIGNYLEPAIQQSLLLEAEKNMGGVDVLFLSWGLLGTAAQTHNLIAPALEMIEVNYTSYITMLTLAAKFFKDRKRGTIAVVTSVAGDRGRRRNYIYDSTKGAVSTYLQGLRQRLNKHNVNVLTIKPGFVSTPMTAHIEKQLLFASADYVGKKIRCAVSRKTSVLYVPWFWRYILFAIRCIPEFIFKRL